jgi:hypothetical protein
LPGAVVLGGTALASALVLALGGWIYRGEGLPQRFGAEARVHIAASGDFLQDFSRCYTATRLPLDGLELCPIGPEGAPRVLVWGDSHSRAFAEGLARAAAEAGVPGVILWRAGCPPLFGLRKVESAATPAQDMACTQANLQIRQALARLDSLETVLLVGRWAYYAEGRGTGRDAHNRIALHPTDRPARQGEPQAALLAEAAATTVAELAAQGLRVFVLRQPPEIPRYDSRKAAREAAHAGWLLAPAPQTEATVSRAALAPRAALADAPWQGLAAAGSLALLDPWPGVCDAARCAAVQGGTGQYFDNNHVTNAAALRLRGVFAPVFGTAEARAARALPAAPAGPPQP